MHGPDFSDSEDEYFADDPDYELYKEKIRQNFMDSIKKDADKDGDDLYQVLRSIMNGKTSEVLDRLDNKRLDINVDLQNGWTPVLVAASVGNLELVKEFFKRKANINATTKDGLTPLMLACRCSTEVRPFEESLKVIEFLVENGANVDQIDHRRRTALMFASYNGHLDAVKYLLPRCNRIAEDNQKWSALFWAVYGNHVEMTEYLINEGFSTEKCDVRDFTALDIAKEYELVDIVKLFPEEQSDVMFSLLESHKHDFESLFSNLEGSSEMPQFFLDVYNMLYGVRNQILAKLFSEQSVNLKQFLSFTDSELRDLGVLLPYQRSRILRGLYQFHKHPFLFQSIPFVPYVTGDKEYSNVDVAKSVLAALKQLIVMESCLNFIMKNHNKPVDSDIKVIHLVKNVKWGVETLSGVALELNQNAKYWDLVVEPVDLIAEKSRRRRMPWRKCVFGFGLAGVLALKLLWKYK